MNASDEIDYSTLNWVKGEIDETLKQARIALEAFVENPDDESQMRFCANYIHQVHGTLQLVEIYGAALVAEEMEEVASAILDRVIPHKEETFDVMMRAILQLPDYLERLQAGQKDIPVILLPILNDLRASRGEPLLSENSFFSPDLSTDVSAVVKKDETASKVDIKRLAKEKRHPYQLALLGWFRDQDTTRQLGSLTNIVSELREAAVTEIVAQLFWVAGGVIEGLADEGLDASVAVKLLMGHVDRKIKTLLDGGEPALVDEQPLELIKNLLYYVAQSTSQGERVNEIKKAYRLDAMFLHEDEISKAQESMTGLNADVMDTVFVAVKEDLTRIKDELDMFVRSDERSIEKLAPLEDNLKRVADTLAMLGLGVQRTAIQEQMTVVHEVVESGKPPDDAVLMEVASVLLYVESTLGGMQSVSEVNATESANDTDLPAGEYKKLLHTVIHEAKTDMARVKEAIVGFVSSPWEFSSLADVPQLNRQIKGSMTMLSLDRASKLLEACNSYVSHNLIDKEDIPDQNTLDALADAITGIEYYLESVEENRHDQDSILSVVESSIAKLGYGVGGDEVEAPYKAEVSELHLADTDRELSQDEPQGLVGSEDQGSDDDTSIDLADIEEVLDETPAQVAPPAVSVFGQGAIDPDEIDDDIKEIFLEEAGEEMVSISENLPMWEKNPENMETLSVIRRSFHTLKGSGRMVGATDIGEFAWSIENMLNRVMDNTIEPSMEIVEIIQNTQKILPELIEHFKGGPVPRVDVITVMNKARAIGGMPLIEGGPPPESAPEPAIESDIPDETIELSPEESVEDEIPELTDAIDESPEYGVGMDQIPELDQVVSSSTILSQQELDPVLLEIFTNESNSHLAQLQNFVDICRSVGDTCDVTDDIIRTLHTLHGSAHMAGVKEIAEVSNLMERYFKLMHANQTSVDQGSLILLDQFSTSVRTMVEQLDEPGAEFSNKQVLMNDITRLLKEEEARGPGDDDSLYEEQKQIIEADEEPSAEYIDNEIQAEEVSGSGLEPETESDDEIEITAPELTENLFAELQPASAAASGQVGEIDQELLEIFLEEGVEILDASEVTLNDWVNDQDNKELVEQLQRELHTLKGGARMANIMPIGDLSHVLESLIESVADDQVTVSRHLFDLMQYSHDMLVRLLEQVRDRKPMSSVADLVEMVEKLAAMGGEVDDSEFSLPEVPVASEPAATEHDNVVELPISESSDDQPISVPAVNESENEAPVEATLEIMRENKQAAARSAVSEQVRVRADVLDNMVNLAGEVSIYRSRIEQQVGSFKYNLTEMDQTIHRLREQLRQFEIETETQIMYRLEDTMDEYGEDFDPLEMDRFSHMQQLSRSLMESTGDLISIQDLLDNLTRESETLLLQQSRVNTELQEGLMRTRMVPFSQQLPRLRRIVRQTCKELGKQVDFSVIGEEGEMDRTVLERMLPPLEHMVRNAIDHGIESPEDRRNANKPETGTVSLTVGREGSEIVLTLQDDGAGMKLDVIRRKAIESGLLDEDADLTDKEIMQYVLEAGFSTADTVTKISGRGVGMDVVNSEIKQLGGILTIDSEPGRGTRFIVHLPLTLSVNKALLVNVGEEKFAIPLSSIEGVVRATHEELDLLYSADDPDYQYIGESYRFIHLGALMGISQPVLPGAGNRAPVLLVRTGEHKAALQVDGLMGSREIVVKSVGPQISTVRGISGATILGDGSVALILDTNAVVLLEAAHHLVPTLEDEVSEEVADKKMTIMVVDDSITVRKVTTRLLERNDMNSVTAKDGVDALAQLQDILPDLILLDIEMPRMDGYELATHIRNDERLQNIPIIMITSRTGEKHRDRAMKIGVNRYMGKPFQEPELLENINALLNTPE